jgi:hypothetical protein
VLASNVVQAEIMEQAEFVVEEEAA